MFDQSPSPALDGLLTEQDALRAHLVIQPVCTTCVRLRDLAALITAARAAAVKDVDV